MLGQAAMDDAALPSIDPTLFFGMLFGSEQFEKYIGKLYLAMQTGHFAKDIQRRMEQSQASGSSAPQAVNDSLEKIGPGCPERRMKRQQFVREVQCAVNLVDRLDRWVIGRNEAGFMTAATQEASELVKVSFGGRLLRLIGGVYESQAEQFFENLHGHYTLSSQMAQWRDSTQQTMGRLTAASSIAKSAIAVQRMTPPEDKPPQDPEQQQQQQQQRVDGSSGGAAASSAGSGTDGGATASGAGGGSTGGAGPSAACGAADDAEGGDDQARKAMASLEGSMPVFLQTLWDVSAVDIDSTLRRVCGKVLKDVSVPWQIRHRRAVALMRLGRVFRDTGQVDHSDLTQLQVAKQHLEEALYGSIKR
eukprot:NODE_867_length_1333_cov_197.234742.p1 GENE.NODE_867_length_1333_cov_197.234742~~NODE_867_length_1333_cov_197.234742.p1  ORF type:complete len:378 (-),score=122.26 NODE_867_length_1333_cov_197.234742:198-1283(-)